MFNKIKQLTEDGMSQAKIADLFKIEKNEVKELIKANEWILLKEDFSLDKIDHICELYKSGISAKALGNKYSIDKRRVQKWVKENGDLRSRDESHRITYFNEHLMDNINTPAKAYWLGFFYADAYNCDITNTFNLALKGSDEDHLYKLVDLFELDRSKVYREINDSGYDVVNIKFYSKHLCTKLTELGCPRAKSFIIKYPEWLDKTLDVHFIRGIFDGDGCLTYREKQKEWKWSITSTQELCQSIANILKEKLEIHTSFSCISKTCNNTYNIDVAGNEQIKRLLDWLYKDSTKDIRLDRKFERYQKLCEQQMNRAHWRNPDRIIELDISTVVNTKRGNVFTDRYTAKCLLGSMSKDIENHNGILRWRVNKTNHFVLVNDYSFTREDLDYLSFFETLNFHYLSKGNLDFLVKNSTKIEKTKYNSYIIDIKEIDYSGNKNKTIRNYMNRYENLLVKDSYNNSDEIISLLRRWSQTLGDKYFRNNSGKNKFFFMNNFHKECECVFVYDKERLVSFGVASPVEEGYCSYTMGKALAKDYPGLSEFTDMMLYEKIFDKYGPFKINMGQGTGGLIFYKKKFPGATEVEHYNGKIKF
jgi:hypothetical protein